MQKNLHKSKHFVEIRILNLGAGTLSMGYLKSLHRFHEN